MAKSKKENEPKDPVVARLDALIRLCIESNREEKVVLKDSNAARILKSAGLTPTEIANILGKKSATDVAPYLYGKKNKS